MLSLYLHKGLCEGCLIGFRMALCFAGVLEDIHLAGLLYHPFEGVA